MCFHKTVAQRNRPLERIIICIFCRFTILSSQISDYTGWLAGSPIRKQVLQATGKMLDILLIRQADADAFIFAALFHLLDQLGYAGAVATSLFF